MFRGRHWCYGLSACHDTYQHYLNNQMVNGEYTLEHWNAHKECEEKYDTQTERTIEEREIKFSYKSYSFVNHVSKHLVSVESNFKKRPLLFHRLYDEVVNWIMETADWTHDSKCNAFTSCSCGRPKSLGTKLKFVGHSVFSGCFKKGDHC